MDLTSEILRQTAQVSHGASDYEKPDGGFRLSFQDLPEWQGIVFERTAFERFGGGGGLDSSFRKGGPLGVYF